MAAAPKTKEERIYERYDEIMSTLPKKRGLAPDYLYQYQGFWYWKRYLPGMMAVQDHFIPRSTDVLLTTNPKCGTTWLKSLIFAICNRKLHPSINQHPLLTINAHQVVPFLEADIYVNNQIPDLDILPSPRLFSTHMAYSTLPQSIRDSGCPMVHVARNPKDAFVSMWYWMKKVSAKGESLMPSTLEEAFEMYCDGASIYGPFWEHSLEYWKASLERPQSVLFFKYEEMKEDIFVHVKKLAEFIRFPFTLEEEKDGVVDEIIRLCSFENLTSLEVNKTGKILYGEDDFQFNSFFRKAKVGDYSNYLTPEMIERMDRISEQKFHGSGLILG